jgi:hypothetical protein
MNIKEKVQNLASNAIDVVDKAIKAPKDIKYIKEKNENIKIIIEETDKKINPLREETNKKLEELGKVKIDILSTTINEFTIYINETKNLPFNKDINSSSSNDSFSFSKKDLDNMQVSVVSIKEILKNTTGAGLAGVASAGAAYSAVAAFGAASTGTLISTISGIAASNATLAWLGGGALAAGGGGIALGTIVLGGIGIIPAVSYLIWKGKFNYAEEREEVDKKYLDVIKYAESMNGIIKNFTELNRLINNTISLMHRYTIACNKLNKQTNHIKNQAGNDYIKYTDEQKTLIQKHITYISKLLKLINTPVMNEDGSFNNNMIGVLKTSNQFLKDSDEIEFVSFKKRTSILTYTFFALVLIGVVLFLYLLN